MTRSTVKAPIRSRSLGFLKIREVMEMSHDPALFLEYLSVHVSGEYFSWNPLFSFPSRKGIFSKLKLRDINYIHKAFSRDLDQPYFCNFTLVYVKTRVHILKTCLVFQNTMHP